MVTATPLAALRKAALPWQTSVCECAPLRARLADAQFVLLGEASHGTHEFYRQRAELTKWLIADAGFNAIAIEGDWPDAYRVNRYVTGQGEDPDASIALGDFKRFPTWMWRNADVLDFVGWLRDYNDALAEHVLKVGFYGLDLYSLYASIRQVVSSLDKLDPAAAARARARYACFDHFSDDSDLYARATAHGFLESCEREVTEQLMEVERRRLSEMQAARDGDHELFDLEQNARLVKNAEEYYRSLFRGRVSTWNLRDRHMTDTLDSIVRWLGSRIARPKIVVWEHNSHIGDARATDVVESGEWTVGQLVRERHPGQTALVGFTTFEGTVTAACDWDRPAQRRAVSPALGSSWEALFHELGYGRFALMTGDQELASALDGSRLERAIGVVYRPEHERASHYFSARLAEQFDAVIHIDHTRAVEPLEPSSDWSGNSLPETYPFAL